VSRVLGADLDAVLSPRNRSNDQERFLSGGHRFWQGKVGPVVGQVQLAGEEPDERPPLLCDVVPNGARSTGYRASGASRTAFFVSGGGTSSSTAALTFARVWRWILRTTLIVARFGFPRKKTPVDP
jgi:hypothetical protein